MSREHYRFRTDAYKLYQSSNVSMTKSCGNRAGVVPKLTIVSGWLQFVRSKQLESGDSVFLSRNDDTLTGSHYKIEVLRNGESSSFVHK
ncbi:hypothetical protein V6N13_005477 [Hibiscus sabdariffa]|uniref:TF-B3 domain-containing protein n=1 Tax=Hibiscus sabdariffa TaxID=183260 RepID=A0ABR2ER10_9ROSI